MSLSVRIDTSSHREYIALFDALLDRDVDPVEHGARRERFHELGDAVRPVRRGYGQRPGDATPIGELIRLVLSERIDGRCEAWREGQDIVDGREDRPSRQDVRRAA